jgi:two-component system, NtrC family, response regulator PilR
MKNGISILVVDDEPTLRVLLTKILTREGFRVDAAADGEEAVEKMNREQYKLVVSDIEMPRLNGFELLKIIKRDYPETAVIMMTAFGDSSAVKDCLVLGADEYITKPFKSFEINLVVERAYWRLMSSRKNFPVA